MGLSSVLLAVLLVALTSADDVCPPKALLAPCSCDGSGISCIGPYDENQLKKSLNADSKHRVVRSVWVQSTKLTHIPGDLFKFLKAEHFYVEMNTAATTVWDMNTFWNSNEFVKTISLYANKFKDLPFGHLRNYKKLRVFNFGGNILERIENNAFTNPNLTTLILSYNRIKQIGENSFRELPSLQWLDLSNNLITSLGQLSLKCNSLNPILQISLVENTITSIHERALEDTTPHVLFLSKNRLTSLEPKSFLPFIARMGQKHGLLEVSNNAFSCKGCDFSWIVQNKETAIKMLVGFTCPDGTGVSQLTHANIGC